MRRTIIITVIMVLSLFWHTSCQTKGERDLDYAISLLNTKPDSCLCLLESINDKDLIGPHNKARHHLYLSAALDKNYIDIASDSIIRPALDYYSKRGPMKDRMLTWYYYGIILNNSNNYTSAVVAFEKAGALAEKLSDTHYSGLICRNIAHAFFESNNIPSSIEYSNKSISYFSKDVSDSVFLNYGYYSLAIHYTTNKDYAQADSVLNLIGGSSAERLQYFIRTSKAAIALLYNNNQEKALSYYQSVPRDNLNFLDYSYYATAFDRMEIKDSADCMLNKAYRVCANHADSATVDYMKSRILYRRGQLEDAYYLLDQSSVVQDSLTRLLLSESVSSAQREFFKQEAEMQAIKTQKAIRQGLLLGSLVFLVFLIIYLVLLSHSKEKDHHLKDLMAQLAVDDERLIDLSRSNAELLSTHFSERIRQIDKLSKDYYSADSDAQRDIVFKQFKEYIKELNTSETFYNTLENDLNKYCNGIIDKFKEQVPSIHGKHLHLLSLFIAGFSYKTVAIITRAQSISSLKTQRSRYRRIIEESNAKDVDYFLEMLEIKTTASKKNR